MTICISRDQIIRCIRDCGWKFVDQTLRVELYKRKGSTQRMDIPKKDVLPESSVRVILRTAGLSPSQIDQFFRDAVK
jgi:hypothetical protein